MKAKKYLLFFLLGYCIYIAIEVTYRGYSFRLMGIAGGLSLAGIGMLEDAGLRRFPLAFQMMVSAVLITAIELYSGMFSLRVLHYRMWDYSALPFSFCDGLICPWFFGIWYRSRQWEFFSQATLPSASQARLPGSVQLHC